MAAPEDVSERARIMAWIVVIVAAGLIVLGSYWYGFSMEVRARVWRDIVDRPGGPMTFRFVLQPTMAAIAALHDGIKDAKLGRSPYLEALLTHPGERIELLGEGLRSTAQIILLGIAMDVIYQYVVFGTFYPVEALVIALLLAFFPYLLLRGMVRRIAHRHFAHGKSNSAAR